jgi:hypothetical protein
VAAVAGGRERLSWFGRTVCLAACLLVVACSGAAKRPVAGPRKVVEVVNSRTPGIGALKGPIDVELAPDGTLYVLDYDDRSEVGKIWAVPPKGRARVVWGLDLPGFPGLDERPDPISTATG